MGSFRPFATSILWIEHIVSKVANLVIPSVVQCRMSAWVFPGLIAGLQPLLVDVFNINGTLCYTGYAAGYAAGYAGSFHNVGRLYSLYGSYSKQRLISVDAIYK